MLFRDTIRNLAGKKRYEGNGFYRTIINRERVIVDYVNDINEIVFTKKDALDNTILKNILFHLEKDGVLYESQRTDTNGQVTFSKLPPGSYKLIEVDIPPGYETPENPVRTFTVGADGVITYTGTEDAFKTIFNTPIQVPVMMVKVDGDTESPLPGSVALK